MENNSLNVPQKIVEDNIKAAVGKVNMPLGKMLLLGIFAGIFIGIAGMGFLANKTVGMFLFAFGLCAVISYEAKLFTGKIGNLNKTN